MATYSGNTVLPTSTWTPTVAPKPLIGAPVVNPVTTASSLILHA